jgi:hypothetical protein
VNSTGDMPIQKASKVMIDNTRASNAFQLSGERDGVSVM